MWINLKPTCKQCGRHLCEDSSTGEVICLDCKAPVEKPRILSGAEALERIKEIRRIING